ncbi:MAG TPA: hypothetical protein VIL78_12180 [Hanamia sp.]
MQEFQEDYSHPILGILKGRFTSCVHWLIKWNFVITAENPAGTWSSPAAIPEVN